LWGHWEYLLCRRPRALIRGLQDVLEYFAVQRQIAQTGIAGELPIAVLLLGFNQGFGLPCNGCKDLFVAMFVLPCSWGERIHQLEDIESFVNDHGFAARQKVVYDARDALECVADPARETAGGEADDFWCDLSVQA